MSDGRNIHKKFLKFLLKTLPTGIQDKFSDSGLMNLEFELISVRLRFGTLHFIRVIQLAKSITGSRRRTRGMSGLDFDLRFLTGFLDGRVFGRESFWTREFLDGRVFRIDFVISYLFKPVWPPCSNLFKPVIKNSVRTSLGCHPIQIPFVTNDSYLLLVVAVLVKPKLSPISLLGLVAGHCFVRTGADLTVFLTEFDTWGFWWSFAEIEDIDVWNDTEFNIFLSLNRC